MTAPQCQAGQHIGERCNKPADLAVRTIAPDTKQGLVSTIYQRIEDAPKAATLYCVTHGVQLAGDLAKLSNPEGFAHVQ